MTDKTIHKSSVNQDKVRVIKESLKQSNTNKGSFTHKKVKNPCGKSLEMSNTKQQNNNKIDEKTTEYKTICPSCKSKFIKNRWLFDYCPVCKSKNLLEVEI